MTVVKSFDGTTGTEVQLEAHVVVAGAASDVNGLAPVGRGIFTAASQIARDQAAEKSVYAPKTPNMPKKNVSA